MIYTEQKVRRLARRVLFPIQVGPYIKSCFLEAGRGTNKLPLSQALIEAVEEVVPVTIGRGFHVSKEDREFINVVQVM